MGKIIVIKKKKVIVGEGFDLASTPAANSARKNNRAGGGGKSATSFLNKLDSDLESLEKASKDCPNKDDPPTKKKPKTGAKNGTGPNKKKIVKVSEEGILELYSTEGLFDLFKKKKKSKDTRRIATKAEFFSALKEATIIAKKWIKDNKISKGANLENYKNEYKEEMKDFGYTLCFYYYDNEYLISHIPDNADIDDIDAAKSEYLYDLYSSPLMLNISTMLISKFKNIKLDLHWEGDGYYDGSLRIEAPDATFADKEMSEENLKVKSLSEEYYIDYVIEEDHDKQELDEFKKLAEEALNQLTFPEESNENT